LVYNVIFHFLDVFLCVHFQGDHRVTSVVRQALNRHNQLVINHHRWLQMYGNKVLAIVLTGMGSDGKDGARMLKDRGSVIWSQDEKSCVVYGMPMAVDRAGLSTQSIALDDIAQYIKIELKHE
jgi:two-component system chemotaxis response regulator CheB